MSQCLLILLSGGSTYFTGGSTFTKWNNDWGITFTQRNLYWGVLLGGECLSNMTLPHRETQIRFQSFGNTVFYVFTIYRNCIHLSLKNV